MKKLECVASKIFKKCSSYITKDDPNTYEYITVRFGTFINAVWCKATGRDWTKCKYLVFYKNQLYLIE